MRKKRNFIRLFEQKKSRIDSRIERDYIENGIATIHCCISNYNDIISTYSAKDQESLNLDFVEYIRDSAEPIPDEYPIVLNIIGDCLTEDEKDIIAENIRDQAMYKLGQVEKEQEREFKFLIFMLVGSISSGLLLWLTDFFEDIPTEIFTVLFWFFADRMFENIFITGHELRKEKRLAGRLASIKVIFSDKYEKIHYTDDEIKKLYAELDLDQ
ncbi:MAG: hypothetical protein IK062_02205 [Selenomonadaceae bacterium]|nr:hypothetical protein [Selenomonadaceae bacterium]MBR6012582.1 hypothetical protein [Selenomonadaceae bacterium]